jgi:hypothetical protein
VSSSDGPGDGPQDPYAGLLTLDELMRWCEEVLRAGADGDARPAIDSVPPLPAHLRGPLRRHGFDAFDETALALTLAPDIDPVLGMQTRAITGTASPYPTLAAIADLVGAQGAELVALAARLSDGGPLVRMGLMHVVPPQIIPVVGEPPRGPTLMASCVASTALLRWVFGITLLEPALFPLVRDDLIAPAAPPDLACAQALMSRLAGDRPALTSLVAERPADALATALYAVSQCGRPALTVDASALTGAAPSGRVAAEALLREAVVIVTGDTSAVPPCRWETLASTVVVGPHPDMTDDTARDISSLIVHGRPAVSVGSHLVDVLRSRGLEVSVPEADRMARWEHIRYQDVGHLASTLAARAAGAGKDEVSALDVTSVAVDVVGEELARLATPLETSRDWSHLVVPDLLHRELGELIAQAEARSQVLEESGFGALPGQPRGVTAVFAGPSGTGKTLAARLVAGELGLPLYAVNLAATVSKYIGETERNLDAVFSAASRADVVLLFDEAEALFGKRSEVQDARDRYANLEISFLLQRMERYDGVAILATNLLAHFDEAFVRRLSFCVHFPFPDTVLRAAIWRSVWPDRVPLAGDVSLDELAARHPLSGGHIRNIAVAATHLARDRGGTVDLECIQRAVDREYEKLGQVPLTETPS